MIYTDGIHLVADSLTELHEFANQNEIKRCWFEGVKRGHPHYDIPKQRRDEIVKMSKMVSSKEILRISKTLL